MEASNSAATDLNKKSDGTVATVAVIIPTVNQAHFLVDAIMSVLEQTRPADEIIIVDDGSTDDPASTVARFRAVRIIRQSHRGLTAARNAGLRCCTSEYVIFLDADDRLLPRAIEKGVSYIKDQPECALVYGGHRLTSVDGRPISPDSFHPIVGNAHLALLRENNRIVSIASVLFRRDHLLAENGFDETLRGCEDYDLLLRLTYRHPIVGYPEVVTEYRQHDKQRSNNHAAQLETALGVLDRHEGRILLDAPTRKALRNGRAFIRNYYVDQMLSTALDRWRKQHDGRALFGDVLEALRFSPICVVRKSVSALARRAFGALPSQMKHWIRQLRGRPDWIPVGSVRFGDFKRVSPINDFFGFARGTPIDRYYIEAFLGRNAGDIHGRVLEIGSNSYTLRFGTNRVDRSDILHVDGSNPLATFIGDLAQPEVLPSGTFDCIVFTQTLQFVFDFQGALRTLHSALKPGGVLLLTTAGLSKMHDAWPWYWNFTSAAVNRLLQNQFGTDSVLVEAHGNVLAATAFLHGIAAEEIDNSSLQVTDGNYAVVVAARAIKRGDA